MNKGQLFSLDFVIAMVIAVLAIGMLLDFYEINTYEQKEANSQIELSAIAVAVNNAIYRIGACILDPSDPDQGYKFYGCLDAGKIKNATPQDLMIPTGFKCRIMVGNEISQNCNDDPTAGNTFVFKKEIQSSILTGDPPGERNPIDLMLVFDRSGSMQYNGFNSVPTIQGIYVEGSNAYVTSRSHGFRKIDISNPTNLLTATTNTILSPATWMVYDVHSAPNSNLYVWARNRSTDQNQLIAIDKDTFQRIGTPLILPQTEAVKIFLHGNFVYIIDKNQTVTEQQSLIIVDVTDPNLMAETARVTFDTCTPTCRRPMNLFVSGNFAYIANDLGGLKIVNLTDKSLSTVPGTARDVTVAGDFAYVAQPAGVKIVNMITSTAPTTQNFNLPNEQTHRVFSHGTNLYVQTDKNVFEFALPLTVTPRSVPDRNQQMTIPNGQVRDMYWDPLEGFMYFAYINFGLVNLDMQNGSKIVQAKQAAKDFIDNGEWDFVGGDKIGLVSFSDKVTLDQTFTNDKVLLKNKINLLQANGTTHLGGGIGRARAVTPTVDSNRYQVILSDGAASPQFGNPDINAEIANNEQITIYTVGFGQDADSAQLRAISDETLPLGNPADNFGEFDGEYYQAEDGGALQDMLNLIAVEIGRQGEGVPGDGTGGIDKGGFEDCVEDPDCGVFNSEIVTIEVWKE